MNAPPAKLIASLGPLAFACVAGSAVAAPPGPHAGTSRGLGASPSHESEEHEARHVVTLKVAGIETLAVRPEAEVVPPEQEEPRLEEPEIEEPHRQQVGAGVAFERVVIPRWLDIEATVLLLRVEGSWSVPADLLFKKPFEITHNVETYLGVGLGSAWLKAGHYHPQYGVASVVGSYFWVNSRFGVDLETEYALLLTDEREHALVLSVGGTARF